MADGIYGATSGAVAAVYEIEAISVNLANVSTTAYKAQRQSFRELLARASVGSGEQTLPTTTLVQADPRDLDLRQGALERSENRTDLALEGPGYLSARDEDGPVFLRATQFTNNASGQLVDRQGRVLLDKDGRPIVVGKSVSDVEIDHQGVVRAGKNAVGRVALVEFADPRQLEHRGGAIYAAPEGVTPEVAQATVVRQGYRERSNVNMVREMSSMVLASRRYESLHRAISAFSEAESRATTRIADD